jgi:photosystem II stability/assembly factor-like uncharacterized protein
MSRKIVLVTWADAHADQEGSWVHIPDIEDKGDYIVTSVGILLEPGDGGQTGHVSLAQTVAPDDYADHIVNIPNGMVKNLLVLGQAQ